MHLRPRNAARFSRILGVKNKIPIPKAYRTQAGPRRSMTYLEYHIISLHFMHLVKDGLVLHLLRQLHLRFLVMAIAFGN